MFDVKISVSGNGVDAVKEFDLSEFFCDHDYFIASVMELFDLYDKTDAVQGQGFNHFESFEDAETSGYEFEVKAENFSNLIDIENFLDASIGSDAEGELFIQWCEDGNGQYDCYSQYESSFIGVYASVDDFAKQNAEDCGELTSVSDDLLNCVDWEQYWDSKLSNYHYELELYNGDVAIFSND